MSYIEIIFLAFALSVDASIISFTYGICFEKERTKNSLALGIFTGLFQGIMPCLGYFMTNFVKEFIMPFSELIIFTIFVFLGIKFIKESFERKNEPKCISIACLFLIGIATSIDAFSAGISLSLSGNNILKPALLIGFITFINSMSCFHAGKLFKNLPSKALEITAGLILIGLGIHSIL